MNRALALASAAAFAIPAFAQQPSTGAPSNQGGYFTCRDASGRMISSDRPIPECMDREQRIHNSDGSIRRVLEAPLTPEQRKAKAEEEAKRAEAQRAAEEQRQKDRTLLSSYPSVDSLEIARKRALGDSQGFLDRSRKRLADLQKEAQAIDSEKEFYKGQPLPATLVRKIEDNAFGIRYETDSIKKREDDIARINTRFDADRSRLGQLLAPSSQPK